MKKAAKKAKRVKRMKPELRWVHVSTGTNELTFICGQCTDRKHAELARCANERLARVRITEVK
jgi:hypothetical protein